MPDIEFYTPKEVAKKLKVNYRTVLNAINKGDLRAVKIGSQNIILYDDYKAYISGNFTVKPLEVAVAVVLNGDDVLLVEGKTKEGNLHWQFPAGRMQYSEKNSTRAEIECLQETGVHCKAIKKFGKRAHPDTRVIVHYWLCEYISGDAYNVDDAENASVEWVNRKKVADKFTSDFYKPVRDYLES